MLTIPLHRNFAFPLQHLCRAVITTRTTYDGINKLQLPKTLKSYLKEYHYKQRVRIRRLDVETDPHDAKSISCLLWVFVLIFDRVLLYVVFTFYSFLFYPHLQFYRTRAILYARNIVISGIPWLWHTVKRKKRRHCNISNKNIIFILNEK